jgi:hypothetical protein
MSQDIDRVVRRATVASIINFAKDSMGNFDLVSVMEDLDTTYMVFSLYHPFRGINQRDINEVVITIKARNVSQ